MRTLPAWSDSLRQLYWQLRWCRVHRLSEVRRSYRRIKRERRALVAAGVDGELVRLACRLLSNPRLEVREVRFWAAFDAQALSVPAALIGPQVITGGMGAVAPHIDQCSQSHCAEHAACSVAGL